MQFIRQLVYFFSFMMKQNVQKSCGIETATFGAGCFWCVEAVFEQLNGVIKVIPGYSGGLSSNPDYYSVCTGRTGHAEVCQIIYDVEIICFDELLEVFWLIHDPTSLNKQQNDEGTHYRSVVFYHNEAQKKLWRNTYSSFHIPDVLTRISNRNKTL